MNKRTTLLFSSALAVTAAMAQQNASTLVTDIDAIGQEYAAQLQRIAEKAAAEKSGTTLDDPYYFPLFAASTLFPQPVKASIGTLDNTCTSNAESLVPQAVGSVSAALADSYTENSGHIEYALTDNARAVADTQAEESTEKYNVNTRKESITTTSIMLDTPDTPDTPDPGNFEIKVKRPNFWTVKGAYSTQFMQYYVSDNWYKGGENNLSLLATFDIEANYDNKQRLTFTNKLETKLGFQTYKSGLDASSGLSSFDRHFRTNTDLIRMTNKLGIQAKKNWYYSAMLQTWTQFYSAYKDAKKKSQFMSPFESVLSVGMDYKLEKKKVKLNVNIAPVAVDFKYCGKDGLIPTHINDQLHPNRQYKVDLGSTLTANMTYSICKQVTWQSRFFFFYNYKTDFYKNRDQIKWEWENTLNLKVNKYLSTKIFLYPRYEGGLKKYKTDPNTNARIKRDTKVQFNEFISVGFDINF